MLSSPGDNQHSSPPCLLSELLHLEDPEDACALLSPSASSFFHRSTKSFLFKFVNHSVLWFWFGEYLTQCAQGLFLGVWSLTAEGHCGGKEPLLRGIGSDDGFSQMVTEGQIEIALLGVSANNDSWLKLLIYLVCGRLSGRVLCRDVMYRSFSVY